METTPATRDERMWAMFAHLAGFAGYFIPVLGNIIGPLVVWQIKREESAFVDDQGREAFNFQISLSVYALAAGLLVLVGIGLLLLPLVMLFGAVMIVVAAVKSNAGEPYRYPLNLRLVKTSF